MRKILMLTAAVTLAGVASVPSEAAAQRRNRDDRRVERNDDRRIGDILDARERDREGRKNGPAFCRSGQGHPVFGREWCRDKGYEVGGRRGDWRDYDDDDRIERRDRDRDARTYDDEGRYEDDGRYPRDGAERWERADWGDIRLRVPASVAGRELNRAQLEQTLGSRVMSLLARHAYDQRVDDAFVGRWLEDGRILRVYSGRVPLAEFTDRNGDRRVDLLRLAYWY